MLLATSAKTNIFISKSSEDQALSFLVNTCLNSLLLGKYDVSLNPGTFGGRRFKDII